MISIYQKICFPGMTNKFLSSGMHSLLCNCRLIKGKIYISPYCINTKIYGRSVCVWNGGKPPGILSGNKKSIHSISKQSSIQTLERVYKHYYYIYEEI